MKRLLWLGTAATVFAAATGPVRGQELLDFRQVILCKSLRNDAERLRCFDRAISNTPTEQRAADARIIDIDSDWQLSESRSVTDDLPRVAAVLQAVEGTAALVLRCWDRTSDVYISLRTYVGGVEALPVIYRFDDGAVTETRWIPSREGSAVFVGTLTLAIAFARALPDDATMYVKVRDYQSRSTDLTFKLGPVSDVRSRIATACRWPDPPPSAQPTAPAAPAVTAASSPAPVKRIRHRNIPANQQRWNVNAQR